MLTRTLLVPAALLLLATLVGCGTAGSGTPKTEDRPLAGFESIEVGGAMTLAVTVAEGAHKVTVSGDDNIVPLVTTTVVGTALKIELDQPVRPKTPLTVTVSAPKVSSLSLGGAIEATITGVSGESFAATVSGAGSLKGRGIVNKLDLSVNGAADADLSSLKAADVTVSVSGAAEVGVHADKTLNVTVSGAASVSYGGTPEVKKQISGAGSVKKR